MPIQDNHFLCVVLNNQHQNRIDEFLAIHRNDPRRPVLFQPYTERHLRQVHDLIENSSEPVPVFLVIGNYGQSASAVGLLHSLEYSDEITPERKQELSQWASQFDQPAVYALNILSVTNLVSFRESLSLSQFAKKSDGLTLEPGKWPASICYVPPLTKLLEAL
ncbi:MAG: hypothetical protein HXY46_02635 [Syntrophaceae bacterium]|nr:hypothetical protein [Syntrophaceae bacterium]